MTRFTGRIGRRATSAFSLAALVALGLLSTVFSVGAAAAGAGGTYTLRAGGDLDWTPSGGSYGPSTSSDPISTSGTLTGPGGSADYTIAAGPGIVRGSIAGTFAGGGRFNPGIQADAASELTLNGPIGFVALPVSLNLHVDSTFRVVQCPAGCNISIGVIGYGAVTRFGIGSGFTANGLGLAADPVAGGFHLHGDVRTPPFGMTPNLPASLPISLQINVNNLGSPGARVFTVDDSVVSFAPSGPVLNDVPAGYTVSGRGVVDNHWTDPFAPTAPTTADLGVSPSSPSCGQPVSFDGSASTAAAGTHLVAYRWDFDDGSGVVETTEPATQHTYASFGVYHPTLVVQDSQGDLSAPDQAAVTERDQGAPGAVISAPATIALGHAVTFDGSGSSDPEAGCGSRLVEWTWSLDGGGPIQTTDPTIDSTRFGSLTAGPHTVTLVVTDDSGNRSTPASFPFDVVVLPVASVTAAPTVAACGASIAFDGSGSSADPALRLVQWTWDPGDGTGRVVTTGPTFNHPYPRLGRFQASLVVTDEEDQESAPDTIDILVRDTGAPTAVVTGPATTALGHAVTFDGSASSDPEAGCGSRLVEWTWSLDGGGPIQTTDPTIDSTRFGSLTAGPHTVTLVVTDDGGNRSTPASFPFDVVVLPVASVTAAPTVAACGASIAFDGSGSSADPALRLVQWTWDPGDGTGRVVTTGPTFNHPYPRLGRFQASLVVTDEEDQESAPDMIDILVRDTGAPTAAISAPASMTAGQPVTFDGSGSTDPEQGCGSRVVAWTWSVDGGSPIQTTSPTILSSAFAALMSPGPHTIGLIVTDDSGNQSAPATRPIQVTAGSGSIQLAVDTAPDSGITITLAGPPALGATQLDGSPATARAASKSFAGLASGTYVVVQAPATGLALVQMTCTDPDGGSVTNVASRTATIDLDAGESIACTFTSIVTTNVTIATSGLQSLGFTPAQATPVLKAIGFTATQVGPALTTVFGISTAAATTNLRTATYTPQEVMTALKNGFGLTAPTATTTFKVAAYPPADVAAALRDVFNRTPAQVARLLKDALFTANETALGLRDGLGVLADAAVAAMRTATFDSNAALGALMSAYGKTAALGAPILASAGYQLAQVSDALHQTGGMLITQAVVVLIPIAITAYSTGDLAMSAVVSSLASAYGVGAAAIVPALQASGCDAAQAAVGLKLGLSLQAADVANALRGYYAPDDIAAALRDEFNRTPAQVAKLMKDAQYTANQVMHALRYGLAQGESAATAAMKFAGYEARITLAQLMAVYGKTAELGASLLANAGYQLAQVADALRQAGGLLIAQTAAVILPIAISTYATGDLAMSAVVSSLASAYAVGAPAIVPALQTAGCTAAQAAVGLRLALGAAGAPEAMVAIKSVYALTRDQVTQLFRDAGYSSTAIAQALHDGLGLGAALVAQLLLDVQYPIPTIGHRLADTLGAQPGEAAQILFDLGATSTEIGTSLRDDFAQDKHQLAEILDDLGYSPSTIAKRLKGLFNQDPAQVAAILHDDLEYDHSRIVDAMKALSQNATETVTILKGLGYHLDTLVRVLYDDFNKGVGSIRTILLGLNYSLPDILASIASVLGL